MARCRTCASELASSKRAWLVVKREKKRSEYIAHLSSISLEIDGLCNRCLGDLSRIAQQGYGSDDVIGLFLLKKLASRPHANQMRIWSAAKRAESPPRKQGRPATHCCIDCGLGCYNEYQSGRCWNCEKKATWGPSYWAEQWLAYCEKHNLPTPGSRKSNANKLLKQRERMRIKRADPAFSKRDRVNQRERMRRLRARREHKAANEARAT
jgi:hypothetical protein